MIVNCYLTTRGEFKPQVLESIKLQDIPFTLEIVSNVFDDKKKHERIAKSKEVCREKAEASGCDFAIIHEDDCINIYPDNFKNMFDFLLKNESYGAVALRRPHKNMTTHTCCGVMMIRKEFLKDKDMFRGPIGHICYDLIKYFKSKNAEYGYIDDRQHLKRAQECKQ